MKARKTFVFLVLFGIVQVFALDKLFLGHYDGYEIPPPVGVQSRNVSTLYFSQIRDHYDRTSTFRWSQRYFVNPQFFNASTSKAVFLMIGGEGQAAIQWMTAGAWIHSARRYGALLFQLEHRFYGLSQPFTTLSAENLRFLSSQQALEDIATFIDAMNVQYNLPADVKWILFGGSYSASLAAWMRKKYPHLVQGAMASSGPIFAQMDFPEYFEVVANSLATHSQQCVNAVRTGFQQLEGFIINPGNENITRLFNLCLDINAPENRDENNISYLFERISSGIAYVVQYSGIISVSIETICNILVNPNNGREIDRLAQVTTLNYGSGCLIYRFQSLVDAMNNTNVTPNSFMRQWYYQTCTEYGWYQTSSQEVQIIGNRTRVEFFTQLCSIVFGSTFNDRFVKDEIDKTNRYYGGFDLNATNIVHVHGSLDPWHPMGFTKTVNPASPVIFITGTSHCADLYPNMANDPPQLRQARERVQNLIGVWLGENSGMRIQFSLSLIVICVLAKIM